MLPVRHSTQVLLFRVFCFRSDAVYRQRLLGAKSGHSNQYNDVNLSIFVFPKVRQLYFSYYYAEVTDLKINLSVYAGYKSTS